MLRSDTGPTSVRGTGSTCSGPAGRRYLSGRWTERRRRPARRRRQKVHRRTMDIYFFILVLFCLRFHGVMKRVRANNLKIRFFLSRFKNKICMNVLSAGNRKLHWLNCKYQCCGSASGSVLPHRDKRIWTQLLVNDFCEFFLPLLGCP